MMITVYDASNITEAYIIKGMLQAHGIESYVAGEYLQGGIGELPAIGIIAVQVEANDESAARKLIHQYEQNDPDADILPV